MFIRYCNYISLLFIRNKWVSTVEGRREGGRPRWHSGETQQGAEQDDAVETNKTIQSNLTTSQTNTPVTNHPRFQPSNNSSSITFSCSNIVGMLPVSGSPLSIFLLLFRNNSVIL